MLTLRIITIQGETVQLEVQQAEFVRVCQCPCHQSFRTIDPDQEYIDRNHKQAAYRLRQKLLIIMI